MKSGNAGVKIYAEDLAGIWLRAAGKCSYCGIEVDLMGASFDHEHPLSKGGYNGVGNLRLCCITCQRSKYDKNAIEYQEWRRLSRRCKTCRTVFRPRWADYKRGYGYYCSRKCSGSAAHA